MTRAASSRSSIGRRAAIAPLVVVAAFALAALPAPAVAAEGDAGTGHWELIHTLPFSSAPAIAVNSTSGTLLAAPFNPNHPPAELFAIDTTTWQGGPAVPVGLAPQLTNLSVNTLTNRMYVPVYGSREVLTVDATTGEVLDRLTSPTWMPYGTVVDESTNTVYMVDGDDNGWNETGLITVIDGATNTITATLEVDRGLAYPAVSSAQRKLYVPVEGGGYLIVVDTVTNADIGAIHLPADAPQKVPMASVVDDALDQLFVVATCGGDSCPNDVLWVIDTVTDTVVDSVPMPAGYAATDTLTIDPVHHRVFVGGAIAGGPANVMSVDTRSGEISAVFDGPVGNVMQTAVDTVKEVLYASIVAGEDEYVSAYQWVEPTPTPQPAPEPTPAAGASNVLPATGWNGSSVLIAGVLITGGVALAMTAGVRRGRRNN